MLVAGGAFYRGGSDPNRMARMTRVILTGHSRGLGAACYTAMLARGWAVLGLSRSAHPQSKSLADQYPKLAHEVPLDLSSPTALDAFLCGDTLKRFLSGASQAVLINNAGLLAPVAKVGYQTHHEIIQSVTANVAAVLMLTNAFVSLTHTCSDRRIIQVSSGAARSPYAGWSVYCATKAALDHHTRCLALEAHPHLRAVSLAPGVIDTDMQAQVRAAEIEQFPMRQKFDQLKESGALASPAQVAEKMLAYLTSAQFGQESCADLRQA